MVRLAVRLSVGVVVAAAILFLPAGTWEFWQGWAYLAVTVIPVAGVYLYFLKVDPEVVERRMEGREQVGEQKRLIRWSGPAFIATFLLPGFDQRLGWSAKLWGAEPLALTLLSQTAVLAGIFTVAWVMAVNRFAARTIRVEAGQKVISTGPYAIVRHPMYAGCVLLWVFTPLALGSYVSLPAFILLVPFYAIRLLNEEKVLCVELPGYADYCLHTRYRLIPLVW